MPKLIAFLALDDKSKIYINPSMVAAATPSGEDQTTLLVATPQGRFKYTVGGPVDEIVSKLNHAMD